MKHRTEYLMIFISFFRVNDASFRLNIPLIFDLQDYFKSDVILITRNPENDALLKSFYKFTNFKAFIGVINTDDESFLKNFERERMSPYQNIMLVSDSANKLLEKFKGYDLRSIMASVVWVNFVRTKVPDEIQDTYIPFNCKFLIINEKNDLSYEILDVYQISENRSKNYSIFGTYKRRNLKAITKEDFYNRRSDLQGFQFVVSLSFFPGFEVEHGRLWALFSQKMNFSVFSNFTAPGTYRADGITTGIFQMLRDHEIDGTASNYMFTKEGSEIFDYIFPTMLSKCMMYVNLNAGVNWTSYLSPFAKKLWIFIAIWILLSTIMVHIILKVKKNKEITFMETFLDVNMRAICCQAGRFKIRSFSLFITYLIPYFLAALLYHHYEGRLLSHLTVKVLHKPFEDLKGAIKDGRFKVITLHDSSIYSYLVLSDEFEAKAIREKDLLLPFDEMPMRISDGNRKLCEGRYIFLLADANGVPMVGNCRIVEMKTVILFESWGIMVWKGFPFKDMLTKIMRQIQFSGLVKIKNKNIIKNDMDSSDFQPLSLEMIFPVFLLHFAGITVCGFVLLWEFIYQKYRRIGRLPEARNLAWL